MRIIHGLDNLDSTLAGSVLTIGNFDGVHRAHQQLLTQAGLFAANTGGLVVVFTFEPHPLAIVAPSRAPTRLTTIEEKSRYLEAAGADVTVVAQSTPELLGIEAERFVDEIIIGRFHPTHIVEGPSFHFGHRRRGNPELLRRWVAPVGCEVHIVDPVTVQIDAGETLMVSSSLIRSLIAAGKVRRAALCLGRPYSLTGEVITGDKRGRTLGFPTANLEVTEKLIPGDSVYVGRAIVGDEAHLAAISIGHNPTFETAERRVEAYLLDFDGDLYGQTIRLEFGRRLRLPQTFDSPEALAKQIAEDVAQVRQEYFEASADTHKDGTTTP